MRLVTCGTCARSIASRADRRPRAHKPRKGALDDCPGGGRGEVVTHDAVGPE